MAQKGAHFVGRLDLDREVLEDGAVRADLNQRIEVLWPERFERWTNRPERVTGCGFTKLV